MMQRHGISVVHMRPRLFPRPSLPSLLSAPFQESLACTFDQVVGKSGSRCKPLSEDVFSSLEGLSQNSNRQHHTAYEQKRKRRLWLILGMVRDRCPYIFHHDTMFLLSPHRTAFLGFKANLCLALCQAFFSHQLQLLGHKLQSVTYCDRGMG